MISISDSMIAPPLTWQKFEDLCWQVYRSEWNDPTIQKNGRSGQPQAGVDIYGHSEPNRLVGIQCKGKSNYRDKELTEKQLKEEVAKAREFRPPLSHFILATSGDCDSKILKCVRLLNVEHRKAGHFTVQVSAWSDIRDLINRHEDVKCSLYPGSAFNKDMRQVKRDVSEIIGRRNRQQKQAFQQLLESQTSAIVVAVQSDRQAKAQKLELSDQQLARLAAMISDARQQPPVQTTVTTEVKIVSPSRTRLLGIIGVAAAPPSKQTLEAVFPDTNWGRELSTLKRMGLITSDGDGIYVVKSVKRTLLGSQDDRKTHLQRWIDALTPLKEYPDTCFCLAAYLSVSGRAIEAINTLAEGAEHLLPGRWNESYLSLLTTADQEPLLNKLTPEQCQMFYYSLALCKFRAKRHTESATDFQRLLKFGEAHKLQWAVGQAYHGLGLSAIDAGEAKEAEKWFRKSVAHARKHDRFLLGRSLYELSMSILETRPDEAEILLAESKDVKESPEVDDKIGLIGIYHGYARLAVSRSDFKNAIDNFKKSERIARDFNDIHAQVLATYNTGRAYADAAKHRRAIPFMQRAMKLAEENQFLDLQLLAVAGEAISLDQTGQHKLAEAAFRKVHDLHLATGDGEKAVVSLRDVGVMLFRQKRFEIGRRVVRKAIRLARKNASQASIYEGIIAIVNSYAEEGKFERGLVSLKTFAENEAKDGSPQVAAELWADMAIALIEQMSPNCSAECAKAVENAERMAGAAIDSKLNVKLCSVKLSLLWSQRRFPEAIQCCESGIKLAEQLDDRDGLWRLLNQHGVNLQELGKTREATPFFRKALTVARRLNDEEAVVTTLNNLGESLRRGGKYAKAITTLVEAEELARTSGDREMAISIAHNRGLSLEFRRQFKAAERVFESCRSEALRLRYRHEYIRSLHALANLAWHTKKPKLALKRYALAFSAASKGKVKDTDFHDICLNYSNALFWCEELERAIEVLEIAEPSFAKEHDAAIYHAQLAKLYAETENTAAAKRQWKLTQSSALAIGDRFHASLSAGSLGGIYAEAGELKDAEDAYQLAIDTEDDPGLKRLLLAEKFSVILRLDREEEAAIVLKALSDLCEVPHDQERLESMVELGTYYWEKQGMREKALKVWCDALVDCATGDMDSYAFMTSVIAYKCGELTANVESEFEQFEAWFRRWLSKDKRVEPSDIKMFIWPLVAARRIALQRAEGKVRCQEDEMRIVAEVAESVMLPSEVESEASVPAV